MQVRLGCVHVLHRHEAGGREMDDIGCPAPARSAPHEIIAPDLPRQARDALIDFNERDAPAPPEVFDAGPSRASNARFSLSAAAKATSAIDNTDVTISIVPCVRASSISVSSVGSQRGS